MEPKNKINQLATYLKMIVLGLMLQGCWTTESDTTIKDDLVKNFKVIKNKNDESAGLILALNQPEDIFQTVEERCYKLYYDSSNIYIKSFKTDSMDSSFAYHHVKIKDSGADKITTFLRTELSAEDFISKVTGCKKCVAKNYFSLLNEK